MDKQIEVDVNLFKVSQTKTGSFHSQLKQKQFNTLKL